MLLLVPFHGLLFLRNAGDAVSGLGLSIFWLHLWRMGLFFAVSGFLAAMTLGMWGPTKQVRQRLIRIGIPLAIGMVTIVPLQRAVAIWFFQHRIPGTTNPDHQWTMENLFSWAPNHLWFLSYLLALNLIALVIWASVRPSSTVRDALDRGFTKLASSWLLVPVLAGLCASALWAGGSIEAPGTVSSSLIPEVSPLVYYAIFFLFGWMLFRNSELLPRVEDHPWAKFTAGMLLTVLAWSFYKNHINLPDILPQAWVISFTAGLATWMILFGVWGLFAKYLSGARGWVRYLADSAYWVYLIHLPFLAVTQRLASDTGLPPLVRLLIATAGALALSFLTYATLVRYTPIGWLLHGKRERKRKGTRAVAAPPGTPPAPSLKEIADAPVGAVAADAVVTSTATESPSAPSVSEMPSTTVPPETPSASS